MTIHAWRDGRAACSRGLHQACEPDALRLAQPADLGLTTRRHEGRRPTVETYPYFDAQTNGLAFDRMIAALEQIPEGDVALLHARCHNPTGADLTLEQWDAVADLLPGGAWFHL